MTTNSQSSLHLNFFVPRIRKRRDIKNEWRTADWYKRKGRQPDCNGWLALEREAEFKCKQYARMVENEAKFAARTKQCFYLELEDDS